MGFFDQLMEVMQSRGVKDFRDMNHLEKETFNQMMEIVEQREMTIDDLRFYLSKLRRSIEEEMTTTEVAIPKTEEAERKRLFLTARLRNMIMIEGMLTSPSEAKRVMEIMLRQLKSPEPIQK